MPGFTREEIDHIFKYHSPTEDQKEMYVEIRESAKELAKVILDNSPQCPSQTTAIQLLRQAVMVANQAIATGL